MTPTTKKILKYWGFLQNFFFIGEHSTHLANGLKGKNLPKKE